MKTARSLFGVVLGFACAASRAGVQAPPVEVPMKVTLCEIKAHPEQSQHKLVEFLAVASHGFEDSMVESSDCLWTVRQSPGVWLEYGGTAKTDTVYCCGETNGVRRSQPLQVDGFALPLLQDDRFREFDARSHPHSPLQRGSALVRGTMQGRIFVRQEALGNRKRWAGYGHMGCCMLFVLTRVIAVDPAPVNPGTFDRIPAPVLRRP